MLDDASVYKAMGKPVPSINTALRTRAEALEHGQAAEECGLDKDNAKHPRHQNFYYKVVLLLLKILFYYYFLSCYCYTIIIITIIIVIFFS
jgi:hypothetical protein